MQTGPHVPIIICYTVVGYDICFCELMGQVYMYQLIFYPTPPPPSPQPDPPQVDLGKLGGMLKSIHHSIRLRNKSTNMATITDNVLKEVYTHVSASWI